MAKGYDDAMLALRREFTMYEHPWPRLFGTDRSKWERAAGLIDRAAREQHGRECSPFDGRKPMRPPSFTGEHAARHRSRIRLVLCDLIVAGLNLSIRTPNGDDP